MTTASRDHFYTYPGKLKTETLLWRLVYESVKMNPKLMQERTLPTTASKNMRIGIIGIAIILQSQYEKHEF